MASRSRLAGDERRMAISEAVQMYTSGVELSEIAMELGKSIATIYMYLKEGGIELKATSEAETGSGVERVLPARLMSVEGDIIQDFELGMSLYRMGLKYNTSPAILARMLKAHGITEEEIFRKKMRSKAQIAISDKIVTMYEEGKRVVVICAMLDVNPQKIYRVLAQRGVQLRRG